MNLIQAARHDGPTATARPSPTAFPHATVRAQVRVRLDRAVRCAADLVTFDNLVDSREHLALVLPPRSGSPAGVPWVRVHSECLTGDVFGCDRCDCGRQLDQAMALIAEHGGAVLYLRQEGRGIGLFNKLDAYLIQDEGYDTYQANRVLGRDPDEREYRVAAQMLLALGMPKVVLLTGNSDKVRRLRADGIEVAATHPLEHGLDGDLSRRVPSDDLRRIR